MRQLAAVIGVVVLAGCGEKGLHTWDKNRDGLVAACEGLNRLACDVTPGCHGVELACLAICRSDGQGGCLPCDDFQCLPNTTPPPPKPNGPECALLPVGVCAFVPACEVKDITVCTVNHAAEDTKGGCGLVDPGGCTTTQICAQRVGHSCEGTPAASCLSNPACELQNGPVCEVACLPGSACPPCATPSPICVTKSVGCEARSIDQCASEAGCMVESFACLAICEDDGNGGCLPCAAPPSRCVAIPPPATTPAQPK